MVWRLASIGLEVAVLDVLLVTREGVLGAGRRFPLIAPDHVEPGAIEGEMEATDTGEQLRGGRAATGLTTGRWVVWGHAEPFKLGGGESVEVYLIEAIGPTWPTGVSGRVS